MTWTHWTHNTLAAITATLGHRVTKTRQGNTEITTWSVLGCKVRETRPVRYSVSTDSTGLIVLGRSYGDRRVRIELGAAL